MTAAAEFQAVSQVFGGTTAVDSIDLTIPEGRLTTLLGPSGCGKTTSLRMLAGYLRPTSGKILIDGQDTTRTAPENRNLGMVFQSYALFPHMSVGDNVGYGLKLRGIKGAERKQRVEECLDMVGLGHLLKRKPRALSGGQQQRVALARAIAIRPKLLLLDEPLSNLDARLRVRMRSEIRRIQHETGLTVVLVTHDQQEALEMSDEMVLMREGTILQQGPPPELFGNPANQFVAEFLGYENFIHTRDGIITVRPEHLRVLAGAPSGEAADDGISLDGTVTDVAYRGVDDVITVKTQDTSGEAVLQSVVRVDDGIHLSPGSRVTVTAPASQIISLTDEQ